MECPGCKTLLVFVPHGNGRYAPPGEPPPPPPSDEDRRLPWRRPSLPSEAVPVAGAAPSTVPGPSAPAGRSAAAAQPPPSPAAPTPVARAAPARPADPDAPVEDPIEALALLGVSPSADAGTIEAAFRERALQCHPDKVAHLDADIQALARRKFRRLQEARDLLLG
jgi:hypothetical protein